MPIAKYVSTFLATTLLAYLVASNLSTTPVNAAVNTQDERLTSAIRQVANINPNQQTFSKLDFKRNKPTNLYLTLYNEYHLQAQKNAVSGLMATEGLKRSDAERFLNGDTSFLNYDDPTELANRVRTLNENYQQEKQLFKSLAFLETQTLALELFANGKNSDSGFDLLDDLDRIEKILFAETAPSQFGDLAKKSNSSASILANSNLDLTSPNPNNPTPDLDSNQQENSSVQPPAPETPATNPNSPNGLACPINPNLEAELSEFEDGELRSPSGGASPNSSETPGQNPELSSQIGQIAFGSAPNLKAFTPPDPKCPNGIVSTPNFCLRVEKVIAKGGLKFTGEQNCVACVIQKIKDITNELTSESLVPNKVTGNFGEPAICKNAALDAFSLRISLVPQAARSDLEIIDHVQGATASNILTNSFVNIPPVTPEAAAAAAIAAADTTLSDVADATSLANQIQDADAAVATAASAISPQADSASLFINQLELRLNAFTQNFAVMREQIQTVQVTLNQVRNKKACQ